MKRFLICVGFLWVGTGLACLSTHAPLWWGLLVVPSTLLLAAREVADRRSARQERQAAAVAWVIRQRAQHPLPDFTGLDRTIARINGGLDG